MAETSGGRLGGARADFVASLGRKVLDARSVLTTVEGEPAARGPRDDLRRKLHALGAGAKLLRFESMSLAILEAEAVLERMVTAGSATPEDVTALGKCLDDLPALAWGDAADRKTTKVEPPPVRTAAHLALVVGREEEIAQALREQPESEGAALFDCERTGDTEAAGELARSLAPDVIVIDGDLEGALALVDALVDDPMTESVPVVVLGRFQTPDRAAQFIALGVAKTLVKPVSPDVLHAACEAVVDPRHARTSRMTLGEPTLEQLGERLAEEVRRAIIDGTDAAGRNCRVPLGEGAEVFGAMWGAIARVREVVTARTDGVVRFVNNGPEGTIALAPWLHPETTGADRATPRGRGAAADVKLEGRRVIVADDDPGVTWFISDLLRTTGCIVHEALDGTTALDLAYQVSPDLVVSDILMPGLDGFALSRILKRDVALRDTPVILLSWKEDLLQRVRELGANASAYLRKESDARAIVARVREALWPRARVETRLRAGGEVRGRLDGLSMRSLLEIVCALRPDSRVSVRDASYLYEVEIRDGAPRRASRTSGDGSFERGERVVASLLGVGAARFVVTANGDLLEPELTGTLQTQLAAPIAMARGAARVLCGARTILVDRVVMDMQQIGAYLRSTPEPARGLIERIANSGSPRQMLLAAEVEPALLEDVLVDLAVKGIVRGVQSVSGEDLLGPAVEAAYLAFQGAPSRRALPHGSLRPSRPAPEVITKAKARAPEERVERVSSVPSSLADAVMRELSHRSPEPGGARPASSTPPPIVEPGDLRKRGSSSPPAKSLSNPAPAVHVGAAGTDVDLVYEVAGLTPSIPIDIDAARPTDDVLRVAAGAASERDEAESPRPSWTNDLPKTPFTSVTAQTRDPLPRASRGWVAWVGLALVLLVVAAGIRFGSGPSVAGAPAVELDQARLPAAEPAPVARPVSAPVSVAVSVAVENAVSVPVTDAGMSSSHGDAGKATLPAL